MIRFYLQGSESCKERFVELSHNKTEFNVAGQLTIGELSKLKHLIVLAIELRYAGLEDRVEAGTDLIDLSENVTNITK